MLRRPARVFARTFRIPTSLVTPLLLFLSLSGFDASLTSGTSMHTANSIIICAPKTAIFETAANLELWPKILPHYRYIKFLERGHDRNFVIMAATRSGIPISWTSEQIIDRDKFEIHFHHLKAWTKGMRVVW